MGLPPSQAYNIIYLYIFNYTISCGFVNIFQHLIDGESLCAVFNRITHGFVSFSTELNWDKRKRFCGATRLDAIVIAPSLCMLSHTAFC